MALADAKPFAVAHWSLDEASDTRADSVGSNDLTDNNMVGSAVGKFGNAADFEASNSEYLSIADNAAVSMGDVQFMGRCWVKFKTLAADMDLVSKYQISGNQRAYRLFYSAGQDRLIFSVSSLGSSASNTNVFANNFGAISTGVWYLVHFWHDSDNDLVGISINAGTADTAAHSGGSQDGTAPLHLGARGAVGAGDYLDGLLDDVLLLKGYILDATERTEDYNGGTGVAFADWDGGAGDSVLPQRTLTGVGV